MHVRTLRPHDNAHGEHYHKTVGMKYEHPYPEADIRSGLVEDASKPARKRTSTRTAGTRTVARKRTSPRKAAGGAPAAE